jgi:predicted PhzF superfamily epimerase YddE/YHI9
VCPLEAWLAEETLLSIAAENNLSETAFLVPHRADYELRWFTPTTEIDLCGHATLASGEVVFRWLKPGTSRVRFHTREAGVLGVERLAEEGTGSRSRAPWLELDFPARPPAVRKPPSGLLEALGGEPRAVLGSARDWLAVYGSQTEVAELSPNMSALAALGPIGAIATAPGEDCDFVSRFFAPGVGVDEDPVTGSAHCVLAPYWATELSKPRLTARQISARGGYLRLNLRSGRVGIAGQVVPYLSGVVTI